MYNTNMKRPYKILIAFAAVLLVLSLTKDFFIKTAVIQGASKVLGVPVHIQGMSVSLFRQSVRIKGLTVDNAAGFPDGAMVDIPEVGVDYDLGALLKGKLHLPVLILDLKQLNVVRNKYGQLNIDALRVSQKKPGEANNSAEKNPEKNMPMQIDHVSLNIGQVTVKDYSKDPPDVRTFNINIDHKTYRDIQSAQQLAGLVIVEAIHPVSTLKDAAIYSAASILKIPVSVTDAILSSPSKILKSLNLNF
jgi:uncharacterized protein involved in outer membrane biogenesis